MRSEHTTCYYDASEPRPACERRGCPAPGWCDAARPPWAPACLLLCRYLTERGVNARFVDFLQEAAVDKEQREYMRWLERVRDFVHSK